MDILLNGVKQSIKEDCNINELLAQLELTHKRLAVEVNLAIVPRSQFDQYRLSAGDKVEIVQAIGGGCQIDLGIAQLSQSSTITICYT